MQPVANATLELRGADNLVRLIASGSLDPVSVTAREERALLAAFKSKESRLLNRMNVHVARGADRAAWKVGDQFRRCMAGRYLALWRSKPRGLADPTGKTSEVRDAVRAERVRQILSLLGTVGNLEEPASATVYLKRKDRAKAYRYLDRPRPNLTGRESAGDRRVIFKFGWIDKARQRLIARSLIPFANYHPSQFLLRQSGRRGRSGVCEYLRQELPNLSADHVFVQVDVRDFFGSISTAWMEGRFRLSEAMIRRQMHSGEMRLLMDGRARAYLRGGEQNERVRRVLPQGSASSSQIAEMAMAEVLGGLTDLLSSALVVTYSDNLGIFMPAAQAAAIEDHLRQAFAASGVGPFELTFSRPVPITDGFTFLGHHWRLEGGELRTFVPELVADRRAMVLREQVMRSLDWPELRKVRARIIGQAHEWKFWAGVAAWQEELLTFWADACEASLRRAA